MIGGIQSAHSLYQVPCAYQSVNLANTARAITRGTQSASTPSIAMDAPETSSGLGGPGAISRLAVQLAQAEHRTRLLRRAALVSGRYNSRDFDQAVQEVRRLRALLRNAGDAGQVDTQRAA